MDEEDDELAAAAEELAATLDELSGELRGAPRGPLGLPRPPTPTEVLRFAEGYAIPTIVAILEANIRVLDMLARVLRVADGRPLDGSGRDGIERASRTTLQKLDGALSDLQTAIEGGEPSNPDVARLLDEARSLREEIDDRLPEATAEPSTMDGTKDRSTHGSASDEDTDGEAAVASDEDDGIKIDVDAELESIKQNVSDSPDGDEEDDEDDSQLDEE
ncbi:MAG: hypothetical protein ACLFNI_09055 [Natronomonas sp.]